jgi:uncharacterized protein with von Willebrand factor type A (vWA) domain
MSETLPLEGLYLHLVRSGLPLSVRDYQDALEALNIGHGLHQRERLRWLCETLWCRHEHESVLMDQLFRAFPEPPVELIEELVGPSRTDPPHQDGTEDPTGGTDGGAESGAASDGQPTAVEFTGQSETGSGLPRVVFPPRVDRFVLAPRDALTVRSLVIAWRRFRRAQRSGPRTELDIPATISEQGRRGRLVEPVLVPARRNQARLVLLVDASPSMAPWRRWNRLIEESLRSSQLASAPLFYFDNVPGDIVYQRPSLTHPVALKDVWSDQASAAVFIVSDAGAARGRITRERIQSTHGFVASALPHWPQFAWLNPMPASRWRQSSSGQSGRLAGVRMFELTDDGLIAAIDYVRGKTTGVA